jgi:hypothetical protein
MKDRNAEKHQWNYENAYQALLLMNRAMYQHERRENVMETLSSHPPSCQEREDVEGIGALGLRKRLHAGKTTTRMKTFPHALS